MSTGKKRHDGVEILIAEDSPTQAEMLRYLFEENGYTVVTVPDGKQALAAAQRRRPTLVISDVIMPELDGYGLCNAIKSDERLKDVPVMLVTSLSDSHDVIRGLECGADNFIRKPYDERYLLSRVEQLLMNIELRRSQKIRMGVEIELGGSKHFITAERQQILDLLISTYEQAVAVNSELALREKELADSNQVLLGLNRIAEGLNRAVSEREVAEIALERAMELPGIQAGWISLREGEAGFRLAAARNLPPALRGPDAFGDGCTCRRNLLSGELDCVTNIHECERLENAKGDTQGLRHHASVPLWLGSGRSLGVMNLAGPGDGLFSEDELKVLHGVGNQVAVAMERARLHEHLEKLVAERTATLEAEIVERKRIEKEQARLVAIIEATPDFVGTADLEGHPLFINRAGPQMLGFGSKLDMSTVRIGEHHPEWAAKLMLETAIPHAIEHGYWSGETAFLRCDGREVPISQVIIAHRGESGSVEYLSTIARDISLRKQHEGRILRLNRVYRVLSGINTTIVRVRDRKELFEEACRIAVEEGGFRMAWIGTFDRGAGRVTPVTVRGDDRGYLESIDLTVEDVPGNCRLLAAALRKKRDIVSNDIEHDPEMAQLAAQAIERGFRSVILLPLIVNDEPTGVLSLYAGERNFFDAEELPLLREIAGDISFALKHIESEERLNYLAYFDEITGLPNRTLFLDRFAQRLSAARHDRQLCSLIMLDLERFRSVNETLGRQAGDELLRLVAQRLREGLDDTDILANLGGDCFGVATRQTAAASDIGKVLDQILLRIQAQPFSAGGKELRVAAKAGVAVFPGDGEDVETLYRNAEAALGDAKTSGQRYLFYARQMNARVADRLTLENKLRKAVERQEFVLYYQPKISLVNKRITGLEALIRWADPEVGLVSPGLFIPLLEETGLIIEVGNWVMRQALVDLDSWCAAGAEPVRIAVNVSAFQLRQKSFVDEVRNVVAAREDLAGGLEMEITESLVMEDIEENIVKLKAIRELGATVAVDDFGTGYSSLSYIAKLPISALKIDRAFIMNLADSPDSVSIVQTIISLAHSLRLNVVAEGVETAEQEKLLSLFRCDEAQGFWFGRPAPADRTLDLLREPG